MSDTKTVFRVHAVQRMFERGITEEQVEHVLRNGEVIEDYPHDKPYPSKLLSGRVGARPIHVVAAYNPDSEETIVITVYEPDAALWATDFRRRKR